jgi:transcriptional regulator with XRE-family HTH domain
MLVGMGTATREAGTELGGYLRARREQLQPADVGLPSTARRRTPGLRREEVATLAGVSLDYLVRLEQGRDTHPSPEVIHALARALRLTEAERLHLAKLAAQGANPSLCPEAPEPGLRVPDTVLTLLERMDATPAFVVGPFTDVLAFTRAWRTLVTPLGVLDAEPVNLARYVLSDARARDAFPEWDLLADAQVGQLRAASVRWADDPVLGALLEELSHEASFAVRWARHPVGDLRRSNLSLRAEGNELRLAVEVLLLPDEGQQLVTWLPADAATAAALDPRRPGRLRVVPRTAARTA